MSDQIPRPTEDPSLQESESGELPTKLIGLAFALVVAALSYYFFMPGVRRFRDWNEALAHGLANPSNGRLLPDYVPTSARDIVHGYHVTRSTEEHWFVFTAPLTQVRLPHEFQRITIVDARRLGREPPAALQEWPPELRATTPDSAPSLVLFLDRERNDCVAMRRPAQAIGTDTTSATFYVWPCTPPN